MREKGRVEEFGGGGGRWVEKGRVEGWRGKGGERGRVEGREEREEWERREIEGIWDYTF